MKTLEYLDFVPHVPEELYSEIYKSLEVENFFPVRSTNYRIFPSLVNVSNYVRNCFAETFNSSDWLDKSKSIVAVQQLVPGKQKIHVDISRAKAYNYIIDCGGENVGTCFYNDDAILVEEHIIEPRRWHLLNVSEPHNVKNITGNRVAITAFLRLPADEEYSQSMRALKFISLNQ